KRFDRKVFSRALHDGYQSILVFRGDPRARKLLRPDMPAGNGHAFDPCGGSAATALHPSREDVPALCDGAPASERVCRPLAGRGGGGGAPAQHPLHRSLTRAELRAHRADCNPDPVRFPEPQGMVTPLPRLFAAERGLDPYTLPTLSELFDFAAAYAGDLGAAA